MLDNVLGIEPTVDENVILEETAIGSYTHIQSHCIFCNTVVGDYSTSEVIIRYSMPISGSFAPLPAMRGSIPLIIQHMTVLRSTILHTAVKDSGLVKMMLYFLSSEKASP